jgi:hypothetical protein
MLVAGACLLWAPGASAGCADAVVVDGKVLLGRTVGDPSRLPPRTVELDAVVPACHDGGDLGEEGRETTVVGLRGVPPHVAVVDRAGATLYIDGASLPALRDHPAHELLYGRRGAPQLRGCRPATPVRGRVVLDGSLRIRTAKRTLTLRVDARTRFTNRPAGQPVREGQWLRVATSRCGSRRVAHRVTFVGATPGRGTDGPVANPDAGGIEGWQVVLVLLFGSAFAVMAVIWKHVGR